MTTTLTMIALVTLGLGACGDDNGPSQVDAAGSPPASLTILPATGSLGHMAEVAVRYEAGTAGGRATVIAFDVEADNGVVLAAAIGGVTARDAGKAVSARPRPDGTLRVVILGTDGAELADGELAILHVRGAVLGSVELRVRSISASDAGGAKLDLATNPGTLEVTP